MVLRFSGKYGASIALIGVIGLFLSIFSYSYMMGTVEDLVRKDAENTAFAWSNYLASHLTDIDKISSGEMPSKTSMSFIEQARSAGKVFRFKLFDKNGRIRMISDELDNMRISNETLIEHNQKALKVVRTGNALTQVKEGKPPKRPLLYAETYLPIMKDGKLSAIVEVYVDQTGKRALYRSHFLTTALAIAAMFFLTIGIGAGVYLWQLRQKDQADEHIEFLASHDALTGGINRAAFKVMLDEAIHDHWEEYKFVAVHTIDIDCFKEVNDNYGIETGDRMILEVADRLRGICSRKDIVSRFGGDEFVVAQGGAMSHEEIDKFANKIQKVMSQTFIIKDQAINSSVSIGTSIAPTDGQSADELLRNSDIALREAKLQGRQSYRRFVPEMNVELAARRKIEAAVRHATFNKSFRLKFQPVYDAKKDQLLAFETLIRLPLANEEEISPSVFIPIAEEMGLIKTIGTWVIETACGMAAHWPDNIRIAINLSTLQFKDGDIVEIIKHALLKSGLASERLELEITEGLLLENTKGTMLQLEEIKKLGVSIAMDDFGTGYSSLSYLWQFPFDKIKIDQSFVRELNTPEDEIASILQTIVSLGHSLKMSVTAEGVESLEQASILKEMSCDQFQGYYFGRPVTEQDVASIILNKFADEIAIQRNQEENLKSQTSKNTSTA